MRSGICRFAVAPSDDTEQNRNIGAQLQSIPCITAPKMFWKIYLLYDVWCMRTTLFIPSRFWTTDTKFDTWCQRYVATYGKKLYIGAHLHTFSALNYCSGIFFKSLSYLYEVVRTNFSVDFGTFRNF